MNISKINMNLQKSKQSKPAFGMYFKFKNPDVSKEFLKGVDEYANKEFKFNKSSKDSYVEEANNFLQGFYRDLIEHNSNAKNHAVYDETHNITSMKFDGGVSNDVFKGIPRANVKLDNGQVFDFYFNSLHIGHELQDGYHGVIANKNQNYKTNGDLEYLANKLNNSVK